MGGGTLETQAREMTLRFMTFFVKIPNHLAEGNQSERKLIIAELERAAGLATNSADAVRILLHLLKQYDLAHVLV